MARSPLWWRLPMLIAITISVLVLSCCAFGERFVYYPRPYLAGTRAEPFAALTYATAVGRQTAFLRVPAERPRATWVLFGGNGALALDWLDLARVIDARDAVLLIDYPGYGACEGSPSTGAIRESAEAAYAAAAQRLGLSTADLDRHLRVVGHSLGAAAALQFAVAHPLERIVLVAPFTSLRAMARRAVGWPLCYAMTADFDNLARVRELAARETRPRVEIIHGDADEVIPFAMGQEVAAAMPGAQLTVVPGGDHNGVVELLRGRLRE